MITIASVCFIAAVSHGLRFTMTSRGLLPSRRVRHVLNHYSFLLIGVGLLVIALAATRRIKRRWLRAAIPGGLAMAMVVAFVMLRTGGGNVHNVADLDQALASGKPVMLEFFSDY